MAGKTSHQDIVKKVLDSKAVDFAAMGKIVAELGPSAALLDEPWDHFCGTMRRFVHIYRISTPVTPVEDLGELASGARELQ